MKRKRKQMDARYIRLADAGCKEQQRFDKLFSRLKRVFGQLLRCQKRCKRLAKQAAQRLAELEGLSEGNGDILF